MPAQPPTNTSTTTKRLPYLNNPMIQPLPNNTNNPQPPPVNLPPTNPNPAPLTTPSTPSPNATSSKMQHIPHLNNPMFQTLPGNTNAPQLPPINLPFTNPNSPTIMMPLTPSPIAPSPSRPSQQPSQNPPGTSNPFPGPSPNLPSTAPPAQPPLPPLPSIQPPQQPGQQQNQPANTTPATNPQPGAQQTQNTPSINPNAAGALTPFLPLLTFVPNLVPPQQGQQPNQVASTNTTNNPQATGQNTGGQAASSGQSGSGGGALLGAYVKKGNPGQASGQDSFGGDMFGTLIAGAAHTGGGIISSKLAQALAPDVSRSNTESKVNLIGNLEDLNKFFQHNQLGDTGLAAAVRAQQAYQRNLLTPEAISNLAKAQQSAQQLETLSTLNASRALGEIQNDRRALIQALRQGGANPAVIAGAVQRAMAEQALRNRDLIGGATQQAMEGLARAQAIRDQAMQNLMNQQQLTYATKVVPTLNQFDTANMLQAAVTPITVSESRSQNYVLPSNIFEPFAQDIVNANAWRRFAGDASRLLNQGVYATGDYAINKERR